MDERSLVEEEWRYVVSLLPRNFEERAFAKLAIRRRRNIATAEELLRLVLAYSVCDFSLRQLAGWGEGRGRGGRGGRAGGGVGGQCAGRCGGGGAGGGGSRWPATRWRRVRWCSPTGG